MKKLLSIVLVLSIICGCYSITMAEAAATDEPEKHISGDYKYIIERGITDSLYYESLKDSERVTPSVISSAVSTLLTSG